MTDITTFRDYKADRRNKSIVAVDNTPLALGILKSIIVGGGYSFTGAKTGMSAMRMVESKEPDLLILGKDMPDMDGYEIAKKVNENGYNVPMIFLSDEATRESVVKAHKMGVKDYIVKPFDRKTTLNKIAKQLALA